MILSAFYRFIALGLACIFFSFQTELDHEEYLENNRQVSSELSFAPPSVTWETFDKQNAPKAFVLTVDPLISEFRVPFVPAVVPLPPSITLHRVRDKSPPAGTLPIV